MDDAVKRALTNAQAWHRAGPELRVQCLPHIEDAQAQVMGAADKIDRQVMLSRLPPHIRDIVRERLAAMWCGDGWGRVIYATDNSDDGYHDACVYLEQMGIHGTDAIRRLPLSNALWVVTKEAPE